MNTFRIAKRPVHRCPHCGHEGSDVLRYYARVGGYGAPQLITCCADIVACLERQIAKRAEIGVK